MTHPLDTVSRGTDTRKAYCGGCLYLTKRVNFGWYCDCRLCPHFEKQIAPLLLESEPEGQLKP